MTDPVTPLTPAELQQQELSVIHENWFQRGAIAFDQLVNVLADGSPDETISSRMARWATEDSGFKKAFGEAVCRALNVISPDHGAKAEVGDLERADQEEKQIEAAPTAKAEGV